MKMNTYLLALTVCTTMLLVGCQKKENTAKESSSIASVSAWDKIATFFGSEKKMDDLCNKGWNAYRKDMPELAIKYCDEAIRLDDDCWVPYAVKGTSIYMASRRTGDYSAISDLARAKLYNTKRETNYFNNATDSITYEEILEKYCWCLANSGNYDRALEEAQNGLLYYSNNASLIDVLSFVYTKIGNYNAAQKWATRLATIAPTQGYFRLAYLANSQRKRLEAVEYYEKVLELEPKDAGALNNIGICYCSLGKWVRTDAYHKMGVEYIQRAAQLGEKSSQEWLEENGYDW